MTATLTTDHDAIVIVTHYCPSCGAEDSSRHAHGPAALFAGDKWDADHEKVCPAATSTGMAWNVLVMGDLIPVAVFGPYPDAHTASIALECDAFIQATIALGCVDAFVEPVSGTPSTRHGIAR